MEITTNTLAAPPTAVAATPNVDEGLNSYEDVIKLCDRLKDDRDAANLSAAVTRIRAFLKRRVDKKESAATKDGAAAVKTAIANRRTFQAYEAPVIKQP